MLTTTAALRDGPQDTDIAGLVRSAAAGNEDGWEGLVHEFAGTVRAVARAYRLSDADAGDVAQATWLRLFEHLDRIEEPSRIGAWLSTTARRECLGVLRTSKRVECYGHEPPQIATDSPVDASLLTSERNVALWRCFGRLRDSDQDLLQLLLISEPRPGYDTIASTLGIRTGSIGPTRARALERLRSELESEGVLPLAGD